MIGAVAFSIGVSLASVEMPALANAAPTVAGAAVLLAGYVQFTAWKTHHLACWRDASSNSVVLPANAAAAWRHGVGLAFECCRSSGNLMLVLLIVGTMDTGAMVGVTTAITIERLVPAGGRVARATGVVVVIAGAVLLSRAARQV